MAHPRKLVKLALAPAKKPMMVGVWAHKKRPNAYKIEELVEPDNDISADIEASVNQPLLEGA